MAYGGDEFVLVLPCHGRSEGGKLAEQIRLAIEQAKFLTFADLDVHITISSGIATYPDDAQTLDDLLADADHALFEAKRLGKNKVVSFSEMVKMAAA